MARDVPAPPYEAPEPLEGRPGNPILAGSAANLGHWREFARAINLGLADGHAANVIHQSWVDQQFDVGVGAVWTTQLRYRIPELSGYHTQIRCRVYGNSASATGQVRFTAVTSGAVQAVTLNAAVNQWWTTANLTINAGAGWEEILVEVLQDVRIETLVCDYLCRDTLAAWPAVDGALPAGRTGTLMVPFDGADVQADAPHSSDLGNYAVDNLTQLRGRERVYLSWSALANPGAGNTACGAYAHRAFMPVFHRAQDGGEELTCWVRASNGNATAGYIYVQHGRGPLDLLHPDNPDAATPGQPTTSSVVTAETIPALSGATWYDFKVQLFEHRTWVDAPAEYGGMVPINFIGWNCDILTVCAWGP